MMMSFFKTSFLKDLFVLCMLAGILFGAFLGSRPLANPDEGRYMEIPREMLLTKNFITPRLNGLKYFEKPVLFYWMEAFSLKVFGINEWAGRFIPWILALLGVAGVYTAGSKLFHRKAGIYAALTLMTASLYFSFAHVISLDMPLSIFTSLGLLSFLCGFYTPPSFKRRLWMYGASAFLGLAFLTKGLVSLGLAGPIIVLWLTFYGAWKKLWPVYLPTSLLLFLSLVLPWHILVSLENPEFLWFYFIKEHFLRYTTTIHGRNQPLLFFIPIFLLGFFPWIFYFFQSLTATISFSWKHRKLSEKEGFLLITTVFIFGFFSLSNSKLIPYILPLFPSLSLFVGKYFSEHTSLKISLGFKAYIFGIFLLSLGLVGFHILSPDMPLALKPYTFLGILCLWSSLFFFFLFSKFLKHPKFSQEFFSIFLGTFVFYVFLSSLIPLIPYRSSRDVALKIERFIPAGTEIIAFKTYPPDLAVYLNLPSPLPIYDWVGELAFGLEQENASWMLSSSDFVKKWTSDQKVCAILKKDSLLEFQKLDLPLTEISLPEGPKNCPCIYTLVCNH